MAARSMEAAQKVADKFGLPARAYQGYEKLAEETEVNVIYIRTSAPSTPDTETSPCQCKNSE